MELFYCHIPDGNFGDDMNQWFWDRCFPGYRDIRTEYVMFGIGSILGATFLEGVEKALIMGSGSAYGPFPEHSLETLAVGWVRGPLTARDLGLTPDRAITDPAVMTPLFSDFTDVAREPGRRLFIPHRSTERLDLDWQAIAERADLEWVSPGRDAHDVIRAIASAELVVTESLHGAIVADAFRTPFVPVAISPTFSSYKWDDWAKSMELDIEINSALAPMKRLYAQIRGARDRMGAAPKPAAAAPDGRTVRVPVGDLQSRDQEYALRRDEKALVRRLASVVRPFVERTLSADLRRIAKSRVVLSSDALLAQRRRQIADRIEEMRIWLEAA